MIFLVLRRKCIFSAIFTVLVTSLTNTTTMAYVAEACSDYSDSATVSPETGRQGVAVQGRTNTFQWIFLYNILTAFFTIIRWC